MNQPLKNIDYVPATAIKPSPWRGTHVLKPDLQQLEIHLREIGWIAPLLVRKETSEIIDGYHRWLIARTDPVLGAEIPVLWIDCDMIDAMVTHVRINRNRGFLVAKNMSNIVKSILRSGKYNAKHLRKLFGMSADELEVYSNGSLIKIKKIEDYQYKNAWIPVETSSKTALEISIERPPTEDA